MVEAALIGLSGNWSPDAVLTSFGSRVDRFTDQGGTSPGTAFERALADELQRAGTADPFDLGPDPQNGTVLDKAGESWRHSKEATTFPLDKIVVDPDDLAWSSKPVGFGDDDASARLSGDGDDRAVETNKDKAFWIGERIVSHPALKSRNERSAGEPRVEPASIDQMFFNGDGRPIVLPSMDLGNRDAQDTDDTPSAGGDLMILPNGAVVAYDPWTATVDGPLHDGVSTH